MSKIFKTFSKGVFTLEHSHKYTKTHTLLLRFVRLGFSPSRIIKVVERTGKLYEFAHTQVSNDSQDSRPTLTDKVEV